MWRSTKAMASSLDMFEILISFSPILIFTVTRSLFRFLFSTHSFSRSYSALNPPMEASPALRT